MSHDPKFDAPEFPPEICDECADPIDETDLSPSCGAHRLHLHCRAHFYCGYCIEEWDEANR